MLDSLRSFSRTWIAKILLAILVVSFGAFGINNVITDLGSSTVARVGDEDISSREFQRAYAGQMNAVAQQIGMQPTAEQALAFGIPSAVISRLGAEAALDKLGRDMGLGASEDRLSIMLRNDPNFRGTLGQFNAQNFAVALQQLGYTEAEYFESQTKQARRQQIGVAVLGDASVPTVIQTILNHYRSDTRTIDYFVVNETGIPPIAEPTDDELQAYLTDHQADFRTVETRAVDVLVLTPESLAATKTFTDAEIEAEYERTKASFSTPERRAIRQVVLSTPELVSAFETGQAEGKTFGELATAANVTPTDLGNLARSDINDATLADAAFSLTQGQFAIIDGAVGKRAVAVSSITPAGEQTLEQARPTIANNLALAAARNDYGNVLDQVEELRAAFVPLTDIATRLNLKTTSLDVTAGGAELEAVPDLPADARQRVAGSIFSAEEGRLLPAVALASNQNVWFDLKSVTPARDRTLDEARDDIVAAWTAEKTDEAIKAEVDRVLGELGSGKPFADVAAEINQFPQLSQPMTRNGDGSPVLDAAIGQAVFDGGPDHFGTAVNGDGDHVIFHVVETTTSDATPSQQETQSITESIRDDIYGQFVTGLRDELGMRINQQALNQVMGINGQAGN